MEGSGETEAAAAMACLSVPSVGLGAGGGRSGRCDVLVLSLFPGIGLLDMAFELEGFCVVRGPDVLWGGDIRRFHPPAGKFDGVIGGPPCQAFSELAKLVRHNGHKTRFGNLIPEFVRCIEAARPTWFVMENVKQAPDPEPCGYIVKRCDVRDDEMGGDTIRRRRFWFGTTDGSELPIRPVARKTLLPAERAITGNSRILTTGDRIRNKEKVGVNGGPLPGAGKCTPLAEMRELQGLPADFLSYSPFTVEAQRRAIGNGVPLPMGRAIAKAVKEAVSTAGKEA